MINKLNGLTSASACCLLATSSSSLVESISAFDFSSVRELSNCCCKWRRAFSASTYSVHICHTYYHNITAVNTNRSRMECHGNWVAVVTMLWNAVTMLRYAFSIPAFLFILTFWLNYSNEIIIIYLCRTREFDLVVSLQLAASSSLVSCSCNSSCCCCSLLSCT